MHGGHQSGLRDLDRLEISFALSGPNWEPGQELFL